MEKVTSTKILFEALMEEFGCENNNQLAKKLDVLAPQIASWERKPLTKVTARNIVRRLERRFIKNSFERICEFRKLVPTPYGVANSLRKRLASDDLCRRLEQAAGIYSFYDSSGRLIYLGKTEHNHLLAEMGQQFSRRKVLIRRTNPRGNFVHMKVPLREFVEYCSAYRVHKSVISDFEALIARLTPNDISNSQIPKYKK